MTTAAASLPAQVPTATAPARALRWLGLAVRLALFALVLVWSEVVGDEGATIMVHVAASVCIVVGLHALIHWSGQISLGHMMLVGVGGFFTANVATEQQWPLPVALFAGALAATLFSMVIGLPALRIRGFSLAITTLAAATAADAWLFRQEWLVGGPLGMLVLDTDFVGRDTVEPTEFALPALLLAGVLAVVTAWLGSTGPGRAARLVAADEEVAASYGVGPGVHRFVVVLFSGFCAGVGGGILTLELGRASAEMFPADKSIVYVAAVLLGGPGRVWGSVAGAVFLVVFPELFDFGRYANLVSAVALVMAVRFAPGGLNEGRDHLGHAVAKLRRRRSRSSTGASA